MRKCCLNWVQQVKPSATEAMAMAMATTPMPASTEEAMVLATIWHTDKHLVRLLNHLNRLFCARSGARIQIMYYFCHHHYQCVSRHWVCSLFAFCAPSYTHTHTHAADLFHFILFFISIAHCLFVVVVRFHVRRVCYFHADDSHSAEVPVKKKQKDLTGEKHEQKKRSCAWKTCRLIYLFTIFLFSPFSLSLSLLHNTRLWFECGCSSSSHCTYQMPTNASDNLWEMNIPIQSIWIYFCCIQFIVLRGHLEVLIINLSKLRNTFNWIANSLKVSRLLVSQRISAQPLPNENRLHAPCIWLLFTAQPIATFSKIISTARASAVFDESRRLAIDENAISQA